jgi:hypothetical protein
MNSYLKDVASQLADVAERTASFVNVIAEEVSVVADKVVDALDEASDSISGWAVTMRAEAKNGPVTDANNVSWTDFTDSTKTKTDTTDVPVAEPESVTKARQYIKDTTGKTFEELWAEIQKGWMK